MSSLLQSQFDDACIKGNLELVKDLLEYNSVCCSHNLDLVKYLLEFKFNIDVLIGFKIK